MADPFLALGYNKSAFWEPKEGGEVEVSVYVWESEDTGDTHDVTGSKANGNQVLVAGVRRRRASVQFYFDINMAPAAMGLKFGARGAIRLQTLSAEDLEEEKIKVRVERVLTRSVVNGMLTVACDLRSDEWSD